MIATRKFLACAVLLTPLLFSWLVSAQPGEEKKSAGTEKSLAEIAPRAEPVKPPKTEDVDTAIKRGIDFLLKDQNKNGSWGSPDYKHGVEIYTPIPGGHHSLQVAVTAMCISALSQTGTHREDVVKSLARAEAYLIEQLPKVRRNSADVLYNVWTHGYGIQALVHMHRRTKDAERQKKLIALIEEQISFLQRYESVDKGWGYYDFEVGAQRPAASSTSFCTAAILVHLREAKDIGAKVPEKLIEGCIKSIHRQLLPDGSYLYGEYLKYKPQWGINRPGGSLGRTQVCNLALRTWGDKKVTPAAEIAWLDRFISRNGWLDMGRKKPFPHESYFAVAGYFYYFGHYYASRLVLELPEKDRAYYLDHIATMMLERQSKDGSWWDFPDFSYHQPYGTAFVLMTLTNCRRIMPKT